METWHILGISVLMMVVVIAIGAMNHSYKKVNVKTPQTTNQILFAISCMIAGLLIYFHHGLFEYILWGLSDILH